MWSASLGALFAFNSPSAAGQPQGQTKNPFCSLPACSTIVLGTAMQYLESQIRLLSVGSFLFLNGPQRAESQLWASCATFVNIGPEVVTRVDIALADSDGKALTPITLNGPFAVGVAQTSASVEPTSGYGTAKIGPQCVLAEAQAFWVARVIFADGSSWVAPPNAPNGATTPTPTPTPADVK